MRATRNAGKKRAGSEEVQAARSLRPRKGVSYALEDHSEYDSDSQVPDEEEGNDVESSEDDRRGGEVCHYATRKHEATL